DIWLVDPDLVVDFADGEPRTRPRSTILRNSCLFSFPTLVVEESRLAEWEAEWHIRRDYLRGLAETKSFLDERGETLQGSRRTSLKSNRGFVVLVQMSNQGKT
ncbi:hypothetical protein FOZ62_018627, partial [Perkinsus olseni]